MVEAYFQDTERLTETLRNNGFKLRRSLEDFSNVPRHELYDGFVGAFDRATQLLSPKKPHLTDVRIPYAELSILLAGTRSSVALRRLANDSAESTTYQQMAIEFAIQSSGMKSTARSLGRLVFATEQIKLGASPDDEPEVVPSLLSEQAENTDLPDLSPPQTQLGLSIKASGRGYVITNGVRQFTNPDVRRLFGLGQQILEAIVPPETFK